MAANSCDENIFDIEDLLKNVPSQPDFVVDGVHFGRGLCKDHATVDVSCWRIIGDQLEQLEKSTFEFYNHENYLVRCKLTTPADINCLYYFYWSGSKATKGLSPLPEESLNVDDPPVERIVQWSKPPSFLQLFQGKFIVNDKLEEANDARLYILRGEIENEAHLFEVPAKTSSLRTRTSFILKKGTDVTIWHGRRSPKQSRLVIRNFVKETDVLQEINEGDESGDGLFSLPVQNIDSKPLSVTPRLFYCNTITGSFMASEIECPHRSLFVTPFPFLQEHLYSAPQPAIFLLVDESNLWIWQGCSFENVDVNKNELKTVLGASLKYGHKGNVFLVNGGLEPEEFVNLFPFWIEKSDVMKTQLENGRKLREKIVVNDSVFN